MNSSLASLLLFLIFPLALQGAEITSLKTALGEQRLVTIQTVSSELKTFIVRLGQIDGVTSGMKSLFSTEKISILAQCIESTRNFSQWRIAEKNASIPFSRKQIVSYNRGIEYIWTAIPELKGRLEKKIMKYEAEKSQTYFQLRGQFSQAFSETTSSTTSENKATRAGFHSEINFFKTVYKKIDFGLGFRYDSETASMTSPTLTIPTTRLLLTLETLYRLPKMKGSGNYFYIGLGAGYGTSETITDNVISSGKTLLFPSARFGFLTSINKTLGFLVEVIGESVAITESYADGTVQTTNLINTKIGLGLQF